MIITIWPLIIFLLSLIILRFLNRKYPIGKNSLLKHMLLLLIWFLIFTPTVILLTPYETSSNDWSEIEAESELLIRYDLSAILSVLFTIITHIIIYNYRKNNIKKKVIWDYLYIKQNTNNSLTLEISQTSNNKIGIWDLGFVWDFDIGN
jgi:hypothetical protein